MTIFVFEVREKAVDAGVHTWMAVERSSGTEFPLPHGGNTVAGRSFVGEYPEIQDFLQRAYRLDLRIVYDGDVDNPIPHPDGKTTWVFIRPHAEVLLPVILRGAFRPVARQSWRHGHGSRSPRKDNICSAPSPH